MTRAIIILMLLLTTAATRSQTTLRVLTRQQTNKLQTLLSEKIEDTARIDNLLKLSEFYLNKRGSERSDLDSAATLINQAKEINVKQQSRKRDGIILFHEAFLARENGATDAARQLFNRAIGLLQTTNDEVNLLQAYLQLSLCYDPKKPEQTAAIKNLFNILFRRASALTAHDQLNLLALDLITFYHLNLRDDYYPLRLDFLDHVVRFCQRANDKEKEFWARKEVADIHYQHGKSDLAINELLQILKEQMVSPHSRICFTYDLLSGIYFSRGNYNKALFYSLETIKNTGKDDSIYLSNFYARVAMCYSYTGSVAEAIDWNLKRVNHLAAIKQTNYFYAILTQVTEDMIKSGRARDALNMILDKKRTIDPDGNSEKVCLLISLARCYVALNNKDMAEKYCDEVANLHELQIRRKEIRTDLPTDLFLASFYLDYRQYDKAEQYFNKVVEEMPKTNGGSTSSYQHGFLFQLDSARGHYLSAINHLQALQMITDSIFTVNKTKQIEELKIAYATEQKDSLINLKEQNIQLLTQQDQFQKSKLKQGVLLRNISFAIAALLIIIIALLFNRYRLKQRTNRKLELQQGEISKQNLSLQNLVKEKDWLVKEIHHRVKNNLQIVMSLLNSQSAYIDNEPALIAIHDSQHRVHAMSLIHQKLYNSENLSSIDMSLYIRELISYLRDSFNTGQQIHFELNIEPLAMDVSQAVPLGLILNEAITNSIKYAFPDRKDAIISISLKNTTLHHYLLTISDNGIGIPGKLTNKKSGSLGMSLMEGLSQDLDGNFSIENSNGTTITVSFVHDISIKRPEALTEPPITNN